MKEGIYLTFTQPKTADSWVAQNFDHFNSYVCVCLSVYTNVYVDVCSVVTTAFVWGIH